MKRPTVRSGGTLLTAIGQLAIDEVDIIADDNVTNADAQRAGFPNAAALKAALPDREGGSLYRIRLHFIGADPRAAKRDNLDDLEADISALAKLDRSGPWTAATLKAIAERRATAAKPLARRRRRSRAVSAA